MYVEQATLQTLEVAFPRAVPTRLLSDIHYVVAYDLTDRVLYPLINSNWQIVIIFLLFRYLMFIDTKLLQGIARGA